MSVPKRGVEEEEGEGEREPEEEEMTEGGGVEEEREERERCDGSTSALVREGSRSRLRPERMTSPSSLEGGRE